MRSRSPFTKYMIPAPSSQRKAGNIQSRVSFRVLPTKTPPKKKKHFLGPPKKIILENVSSLLVDSKVRICHDSRPLGIGNHLQRSKCPGHYIDLVSSSSFFHKKRRKSGGQETVVPPSIVLVSIGILLGLSKKIPKNVGHSTKARRIDFEK